MLKGTTKIELTDVNTGKTEVIEKHNTVTGALQQLFNASLGHITSDYKLRANLPAYKTFLGGLLLFNDRIDGDPLPIFAPETVKLVGCARYDTAVTNSSKYFGSYDGAESAVTDGGKTVKFVYNFTQAQANGTIGSICLTHLNGGLGAYAGDFVYKSAKLTNSIYVNPSDTTNANTLRLVRNGKDRSVKLSVDSGTNVYEHIFAIDLDNDLVHYFKLTTSKTLVILKRRLGLKSFSLLGANGATVGEPVTINLDVAINTSGKYSCYYFDTEERALYFMSNGSNDFRVLAGNSFTVTRYKLGETSATQKSITNTYSKTIDVASGAAYRGRLYFPSNSVSTTENGLTCYTHDVVSFGIDDNSHSTHGNILSVANYTPFPMLAFDGRLYWQSPFSTDSTKTGLGGLYVTDCVATADSSNTSKCGVESVEAELNSTTYYPASCTPVIGHPMFVYMSYTPNGSSTVTEGFYFLSHYLATINNLATPIVKAPTQTMKITYTITEM